MAIIILFALNVCLLLALSVFFFFFFCLSRGYTDVLHLKWLEQLRLVSQREKDPSALEINQEHQQKLQASGDTTADVSGMDLAQTQGQGGGFDAVFDGEEAGPAADAGDTEAIEVLIYQVKIASRVGVRNPSSVAPKAQKPKPDQKNDFSLQCIENHY